MAIAHSKLTSQGQISVPAEVRRKLGLGPGSVLEWVEQGSQVIVRHAGRHSSEDIHKTLFPAGPPEPVSVADMRKAVRVLAMKRHARGRY